MADEIHIELYKRAVGYLSQNSVPLPVEATKPEIQEELRKFAENADKLDLRTLCDPEGKLQDFPYPYLMKLIVAYYQIRDAGQTQQLREADAEVRRARGVTSQQPGSNAIPEPEVKAEG